MKPVIPNLIRNLWKVNVKPTQMLSQAQHDGLQFRATVCSLGAYGHSELDSESVEDGARTYTDAESSSA